MTWKEFKDFVKSRDGYIPDENQVIIDIDHESCPVEDTSIDTDGNPPITFIENHF